MDSSSQYDDTADFLYNMTKPAILSWVYRSYYLSDEQKEYVETLDTEELIDYIKFAYFL